MMFLPGVCNTAESGLNRRGTAVESEKINKVRALYQAALERDPEERRAYLDEACANDPELKEKVASLLSAGAEASRLFEQPAWRSFVESEKSDSAGNSGLEAEPGLPFERLGEFRLIRRLGKGGMGVVYLAVQERLGRQVALKVLRTDQAASFEAEKRFWREIEAVSKLRHPNIVTLFGSGEEKGVRYFAMELVPGQDLNEVLAEAASRGERIAPSRSLAWIREIARALAAAHQAGIIHRDVKPTNIRIDPEDRVKLMDFGVARNMKLSKMTLTGEFRGTPHYAAPEQVDAKARTIDARTDVYALGVTLYEAVTGRVPFEGETYEQVFRQILERDPAPPRRLNRAISRDLETVILTALEKDPGRRYPTMADFADDIDRLLQGEMIHARPIGAAGRLWKRVRRNPALSAALTVTLLAVGALILSIPWYIIQIRGERDEAETEAKKANMVNEFLETMFSSPDPGEDGREVKVVDVLGKAAAEIDTAFPDEPEIQAFLLRTIGSTYYRLGLYDEAGRRHKAALEIRARELGEEHPDTLQSMNDLGMVLRKQSLYSDAEGLYRRALGIQRSVLGEEHPDTLTTMNNIANALRTQGRISEAEPIYRKVLEIRRRALGREDPDTLTSLSNLALVQIRKGLFSEAEVFLREVLEARRRLLGEEHPDTITSIANLGLVLYKQDRLPEAEQLLRETLEIQHRVLGDEHSDMLLVMYNLAELLKTKGELAEAEELFRKALDIQRRILGDEHRDTLLMMRNLAKLLYGRGRLDEAGTLLKEGLDLAEKNLPPENPIVLSFRKALNEVEGKKAPKQ